MYLKKKEKKKKSLNRAAFSRQRGFFFSFWQRALGAKPRSYLSAVWHQGRPTCVSRPSRDPWLMARHWVVLILSVGRVWHFIHNSVKKKKQEKKQGKEGRCVSLGGRRPKGTHEPGCTAEHGWIILGPTVLPAAAENHNSGFSCFPWERNDFSFIFMWGRTTHTLGGQCSLSDTAGREGCQRNREYDTLIKKLIKVSTSSRKALNQHSCLTRTRFKWPSLFLQMHSFNKIYYLGKLFLGRYCIVSHV